MSKKPLDRKLAPSRVARRGFGDEFEAHEAVQMLLDGHTASSVAERLGLSSTNLLYRWKREQLERSGPVATSLEARVRELEVELHRVEPRARQDFKKSVGYFRPARVVEVSPSVVAISQSALSSTVSVCDVLDVSRSAYYAWRSGDVLSPRRQRDEELTPLVRALFWKHRRRYGARRIASKDLADLGEACRPPKHVAKLLKTQGLRAIQPKSFVPKTTDSRHRLGYSPNLLLEAPATTRTNQLWVGDIHLHTVAWRHLQLLGDADGSTFALTWWAGGWRK